MWLGAAASSHAAPARVLQLAHGLHRQEPPGDHIGERRSAAEDRVAVGQPHPLVGELVPVEDVQRLVDADEVGNPGDAVDFEDAVRVFLPLVVGAAGEPAQEFPRVLIP